MENQSSGSLASVEAQAQLRAAREAQDGSVRRAITPAWCIFALSVFCGVQTVAPVDRGPGNVVSIIAVVGLLAALLNVSARNHWRSLRSLPKPKWGVPEVMLISVAVLVGGVVGPHLLAGRGSSALVSWGLGAAVTAIVTACLLGANASYQRRISRAWQR